MIPPPPRALCTPRLVLRLWRDEDLAPFAALNADAAVMEHLPGVLSREESDAMVARLRHGFDERGFGLWAVEAPGEGLIGFAGLSVPRFVAPFMPAVEVGWRLARAAWGKGYATEAARAALNDGFQRVGLREIVSFTVPANTRSRRVMERLGMTHAEADDFDHPVFPEGHRLRRHVLYRVRGRDGRGPA